MSESDQSKQIGWEQEDQIKEAIAYYIKKSEDYRAEQRRVSRADRRICLLIQRYS